MADQVSKKPGQAVAERPLEPSIPDSAEKTVIRDTGEREEATPERMQSPPPYLVILEGPRTGTCFPLKDGENIIGRAPGNEIRLDDQSVSRQHAEVSKSTSGWMVKDLGSKNGTMVNAKELTDSVVIGHKDIIKTGIYQLRLILQPTSREEELALPPEQSMLDRTVFVSAPPDSLTARMEKEDISAKREPGQDMEPLAEGAEGEIPQAPVPKRQIEKRTLMMVGALLLVVIIAGGYFANRIFFGTHKVAAKAAAKTLAAAKEAAGTQAAQPAVPEGTAPPAPPPVPPVAGQPPQPAQPAAPQPGQPPQVPPVPPAATSAQKVPIFLDIASSPMPAKVSFQGQDLGVTPLRVNVELEQGKTNQAEALFVMPEINQQYAQKVDFKADVGTSVVPVLFRGPIGMLKINQVPRDTEFYLEGKFSYDKFTEQTAKLKEIVLQKPIYIPFGHYIVELRRSRQLGETSPTVVSDIIFRREFDVAEDSPTFTIDVKDEDLKIFPVKVKSDPSNAEVFIDGKSVGRTPYEGTFPLGEHRLVLQKEGYFEHAEDLKVDINMPFVANVTLKTSVAGAHLNNARLSMNRQMYQEAINELAQALSSNPAPSETALSNLLLGQCYFKMNDVDRAMGYFEQARQSEDQKYPAMLGLVNCYAIKQQVDKALPLLVEVMLKNKDENVKREANDLFQKISPFRSVIYVYSDPMGAKVVVNDTPVAQQTPVILHELPLGNYRIRIEKAGYLPQDLNISLSINEFNPVIVKLKPIPQ
ncbi:MAG: PEGA domain-containing protein [bacterium]